MALEVSRGRVGRRIGRVSRLGVWTAVCTLLAGCTTYVSDLAISHVTVLKNETPAVLQVDLSTRSDLSGLTSHWGVLLHSENIFCDEPDRHVVLGWHVETLRKVASPKPQSLPSKDGSGRAERKLFLYSVRIPISRKDVPSAIPPEYGFDLEREPRDICMRLGGGYIGVSVRSNAVRLRADDIRTAFRVLGQG